MFRASFISSSSDYISFFLFHHETLSTILHNSITNSTQIFFKKKKTLPRSTHSLVASYSFTRTSVPNNAASATFLPKWNPSMVRSQQKPIGRVSFSSSGDDERRNREILVQHLFVGEDNFKLLLELQQRIATGEDLSDLAVEYSGCPSKENGGMLGWVRKGQMVPEFEEAAFTAPLNKVVRCKTKYGWHSERARASLPDFTVLPVRLFGTWGAEISNKFDPQKNTYVLCHHGMRSQQVAQWMLTQGFKKVFNITGGIHAYAVKADCSIPTY